MARRNPNPHRLYSGTVDRKFVEKVLRRFFESYNENRENDKSFLLWMNKKGNVIEKKEWWCSLKDFTRLINMSIMQYKEEKGEK